MISYPIFFETFKIHYALFRAALLMSFQFNCNFAFSRVKALPELLIVPDRSTKSLHKKTPISSTGVHHFPSP